MTSLDELRAIHTQRIADERATFEAERVALVERRRRAELEAMTATDAKLREEREAQLRIEEARVAAERAARMTLEAMEAAERTRFAAELAAQRQAQELELRREEVANKRPRWMIAVTTIAVAAGIMLGYFAVQSSHAADEASDQRAVAERQKQQAHQEAQAARHQLATIEKDLDTAHAKLQQAETTLVGDELEAKQIRANQARAAVQAKDAAERKQLADRNAKELLDERHHGLHMDKCVDTSIGCVKR